MSFTPSIDVPTTSLLAGVMVRIRTIAYSGLDLQVPSRAP